MTPTASSGQPCLELHLTELSYLYRWQPSMLIPQHLSKRIQKLFSHHPRSTVVVIEQCTITVHKHLESCSNPSCFQPTKMTQRVDYYVLAIEMHINKLAVGTLVHQCLFGSRRKEALGSLRSCLVHRDS